jgi:hypothetical protein
MLGTAHCKGIGAETAKNYTRPNNWLLGWFDIGTRTKVPLRFVTYLLKVKKKVF